MTELARCKLCGSEAYKFGNDIYTCYNTDCILGHTYLSAKQWNTLNSVPEDVAKLEKEVLFYKECAETRLAVAESAQERATKLEEQIASLTDGDTILRDLRADMHNFELVIDTNPFLKTLAIWGLEFLSQNNAPNHMALTLRNGDEPLSIVIERPDGQTTAEKISELTSQLEKSRNDCSSLATDFSKAREQVNGLTELLTGKHLELTPIEDWDEDDGQVLCWPLAVQDPPCITSPLTSDWIDNYYTHFSPIPPLWKRPDFEAICDEAESLAKKQFPIHSTDHEWRTGVPWKFARQYESQMMKNHYQSMEKLAERGGLSAKELYACLRFRTFESLGYTNEECRALVDEMLKEQGYE